MNNNINIEVTEIEISPRSAYAREYYLKNAAKLRESSKRSHAKLNVQKKLAMHKLLTVIEAIDNLMNDEMRVMLNSGYEYGLGQFEDDIEFIKAKLCSSVL